MQKRNFLTESLTTPRLWAIFFIQLSEGYQINVIFPFVVFMIRDFGFNEDMVGIYAGLLTATFAFCQFISSYFWGLFSDKYGRRMALVLGLSISGLAILMFGTSTGYFQAVSARAIAGVFNGNIAVARAYVADITTGHNRAFAFSIFVVAFSAGIVLGSTCGGGLINTYHLDKYGNHKQSEGVLEWWIFHTQFPYLLPCVVGCIISFIAFGFTLAFVKDVEKAESKSTPRYSISLHSFSRSRSKSFPPDDRSSSALKHKEDNSRAHSLRTDAYEPHSYKGAPILDVEAIATNALYDGVESLRADQLERAKLLDTDTNKASDIKIDSLGAMFRETPIIHGLVTNATVMVMLVAWNALVPLLLAQSLFMDSLEIGIYMAYNGLVLFVFTWWIQPPLLQRYTYKSLYVVFGMMMVVLLIVFPSITLIPGITKWNSVWLVAITSFIGSFKYAFSTNIFVVSICFVNNSVPPSVIGRANGLAQAVGCGLRGLGPLIGGALWSWSMTLDNKYAVYITYVFMVIPVVYSVIHCVCFIENDIQLTWDERHRDRN